MTISYIRDCVAIYGQRDNLTTGEPVLKYNKMLTSCNFICAIGALDTLQSSHISAKGGIFPPKAAYGSLDLPQALDSAAKQPYFRQRRHIGL